MTDHEIKLALGDLQREVREVCGYAPPPEVDFIDYRPQSELRLAEALSFYASNSAGDGGKLAREALEQLNQK